ncbi:DUF1129 domain-containing protein [Lactiplantibacillus paraplantarum]|uniref:DUF1129 domain-containing protein n=1 Tax=Lactiplantibacillus TaxID=2767842 RepID=UPI000513A2E5|nr:MULTISPECIES: DUF1129 domain-containing protein [Lactiplantibacillus]OAX75657.1 hypothetical protein A0U96_10870 [Lactiplantibacillus plantarum]ALO05174.1 hypothetical protein ASU28_12830 [Lactiplantibacillus paraplantarum]KGE75713.1 membrane protein [Lactiplantibacillus paraplantarum]MCT4456253.1 DUF1129 domain-containing protein [Lactiplantibacillus paraplantarum]MCW1911396.1 DUF1129 domain-containing protein [Lactiplantibacillus paraplantarum]
MSESETSKTPRNAAAGAKQAKVAERPIQEATELTKRNAEYMRQMRKSLDGTSLAAEKKTAVLNEMTTTLLAEQGRGTTARQLYGTVQERTEEIVNPKKTPVERQKANYWVTALDNGLMLFMIFCLMYGIMGFIGTNATKNSAGANGITAILITSAIGGLGVAKLFEYLMPAKDGKKVSLWKKILWSVLAIIVWMLVFTTMSMIQGPLNPVLPGIAYLIIAVVVFFARMWLKRRFNITTSMF